jgi:glycosyltransferase involved in cell wall biosynthesis
MNLVSVVIPSYNHAAYLKQAVESVLAQTYKNFELIVIDDGSTDASLNYLRTVKDARFILVEQANAGAHNAINKGLEIAKGQYLAILNSDDAFHPERLEICISRIKEGIDLVASWIEIINEKGKVLGVKEGWRNMLPWSFAPPKTEIAGIDNFTLNLLMSNFVSTTSNIVFTRRLYNEIGGMRNLRFVHDWDFLLRAAKKFRCELIERPLLQYRTHTTNTISSNRAWMLFEICWVFAVHLQTFTSKMFIIPDVKLEEINFLANSINAQGNEKVLWLLLHYINESHSNGVFNPEENLINDAQLRSEFICYISTQ